MRELFSRRGRIRLRRRPLLLLLAAAGAIGVMGLAYRVATTLEVVRKGELFSYTDGTIYEVRLLDKVTVYVEPSVRPSDDLLNAYLLASLSSIALFALLLVHGRKVTTGLRVRAFFLLTALGAGYLAADELFGFHESIGHNMRFLADLPGSEQPDGAILVAYLIPVGAYLFVFRNLFLASRTGLRLILFGLAFGVLASGLDFLGGSGEELAEVMTSASVLAAFVVVTAEQVHGSLKGPSAARRPPRAPEGVARNPSAAYESRR